MFNPMEWGGYLSWRLDPSAKVFIDGRLDFYPDAVWNDYLLIASAESGWEQALERHKVDLVIWSPAISQPLPVALTKSPRWQLIHRAGPAVVFARRP